MPLIEAVLLMLAWNAIVTVAAVGIDGYLADRRQEKRVHDALLRLAAKQY